jgi:hypothetical protein
MESDGGRGGKAWQDDDGGASYSSEAQRLAWPQSDAVHQDAGWPQPLDDAIREVSSPFGGAPREDDQVMDQCTPYGLLQGGRIVRTNAHDVGFAAVLPHSIGDDARVRIVDFALRHRLPRRDQFIPRGDDGHAWLPVAPHLGTPERRQYPRFPGR